MREIGKVALNVTHRSGFDKSHRNLFTGKTGTLYPILTEEVLPNSTIHLRQALSAKLPPLASDTFMNVQLKTEAFFVPYRLLYGGWENWLMETPLRMANGVSYKLRSPKLRLMNGGHADDSLVDMLGFRRQDSDGSSTTDVNIYPFLAYHRIYDDWYRASRIQVPLFVPSGNGVYSGAPSVVYEVANLPFLNICDATVDSPSQDNVFDGTRSIGSNTPMSGYFCDGSYILDLRQRNFGLDYFTAAAPSAQRGSARSVRVALGGDVHDVIDSSGNSQEVLGSSATGDFTIASLRAQNSLQQFCERNNFSFRASDFYYINYGSRLRSGLATRCLFLGQQVLDVYTKSVMQNTPTDASATPGRNPFNSVGAQYGSASINGNDSLIDNFTADEPGILMVMASLVPKVTYTTGVRRYLSHFTEEGSQVDLANAVLQNVGQQPIYLGELVKEKLYADVVFGYTDRYAEWMDHVDEVHGLLKDGRSLESFALQRSFDGANPFAINSDFIKIPQDYLDQVFAVDTEVSGLSYWAEAYFDFKVVQPLQEYSIPSLQDPAYEHGHRVVVKRNDIGL